MQPRAQRIANHAARVINTRCRIHGEAKRNGVNRFAAFFGGAAAAIMQNGAQINFVHGAATDFPLQMQRPAIGLPAGKIDDGA